MQLSILHSCRLKESNEPCYSEGHNARRGGWCWCTWGVCSQGEERGANLVAHPKSLECACRRRPGTCFLSCRLTSALLHSVWHCVICATANICGTLFVVIAYSQQSASAHEGSKCICVFECFWLFGSTKMLRRDKRGESFWRILTLVLLRHCTFAWLKSSETPICALHLLPRSAHSPPHQTGSKLAMV